MNIDKEFWGYWIVFCAVGAAVQFLDKSPDYILIGLAMGGAFGGYHMSRLDNGD